jgi:hypothetical protein
VGLADTSVSAIRDQVRAIETAPPLSEKPDPNYRQLHDLARHAIYVTETLDVAIRMLDNMLAQYQKLRHETAGSAA